MKGEFEISLMGKLSYFLGLQIKQTKGGIFFNQSTYTKEILKKFKIDLYKPMKTPFNSALKLDKDGGGEPFVERLYRGMIGSLLYLIRSRPDILFRVCVYARF